jgi:hypothetical protein
MKLSARAKRRRLGLQLTLTAVALVFVVGTVPGGGASAWNSAQRISSPAGSPAQVSKPAQTRSRVAKSGLRMKYETVFTGIEDPLSEGGAWSNNGLDWARVVKTPGMAAGTQGGNNGYDDSYATLSGFPPNQSAKAVLQIKEGSDQSCTHEVELHLRWSDAPNLARGYEVLVGLGSYLGIVRWNGPIGDFTELAFLWIPPVKDGDVFRATVRDNVITAYINGVPLLQATDSTFSAGNPGIGFFRRNCGTNQDFTFRWFKARALKPSS